MKNLYLDDSMCIRKLSDGNLLIAISNQRMAELDEEYPVDHDERSVTYEDMYNIFEDVYEDVEFFAHNSGYGLTDSPMFLERVLLPEGEYNAFSGYNPMDKETDWNKSNLYWYPAYMVDDWIDRLITTGVVIFTGADNKQADQFYSRTHLNGDYDRIRPRPTCYICDGYIRKIDMETYGHCFDCMETGIVECDYCNNKSHYMDGENCDWCGYKLNKESNNE